MMADNLPEPDSQPLPFPEYRQLFEAIPGLYLVLTPDFRIVAVTDGYLQATKTSRSSILGRGVFDVFPDNPDDPTATGERNLRKSLERVLANRVADAMPVQRYDIRRPIEEGGGFEKRYWNPTNSPLLGKNNEVAYIIHHVEDVTELTLARQQGLEQEKRTRALSSHCQEMESEILRRTHEQKDANDQLRIANEELERTKERCAAEEMLARERVLLRTLIDTLPDAIWTKDADCRFALSNPGHNRLVGRESEQEVVGKTGFDFHPHDLAMEYHLDDLRVLRDGETIMNKEEQVRTSSGQELWHLAIKAPIRDRDGKITGLVGISRNIQYRKEAELVIRASERRHRAFFEVTTAGVVEVTTDARIIRANEAFCRMLGYSTDEIIGMPVVDLLFPEDREETLGQYQTLIAERTPAFEAERRYKRKDGAMIWARASAVLVRDENGKPSWLCGVVIDLTARRKAEEFLRASEERFRLLVEGVKDYAVFMTDVDGNIVTWNTGAARVFGYPATAVENRSFSIFYPQNEVSSGLPNQHLEQSKQGSFEVEGWRVRKDGSLFWANTVTTALRNHGESLRGYAMIVRDTTERMKLENQFRQAQKMEAVGRLAGGIAHDFNNLLTIINGYCEILTPTIPRDHANWAAVNSIREAGERAAALTAQLLAFSRKAIVEPKVLDLNEVVDQLERLLRRLIGEDILLTTALVRDLQLVRADPTQMEQIVLNLAVNARDAMPRGGKLTIETQNVDLREGGTTPYPDLQPGRYVQLAVSDTGVGMTEEVKTKIFEPFFTTKEAGHGTGLGLSMVYGAVKTHKGNISVYSELGVGTTFKILLPVSASNIAPKSTVLQLAPRGTETVLLVEDEEDVRKLAKLALQMYGYTVLDAGCGADGIKIVKGYSKPIHLLVTDVVMPGMSGREVAEAVRLRFPNVKVLYASGYTDDAVVRHGIVEATDAFLQKPFTPLMLARKVRTVLDSAF
jgi:two-component system cell cycle sensor histidine kinase/response regulator CckA